MFLMQTYQPGDKVFFFGFSRGAYTVRVVASLLHMYGLLRPGNEALVPYAVRMMMAITKSRDAGSSDSPAINGYFKLAAEFKATMARDCKPWFVGVWDTVSSVGWIENPVRVPFTADNPDIEFGRHAIAIDERRAFFRTNLWRQSDAPGSAHGRKNQLQVWFPGVHCDVGGGYAENESGLSKLSLEWMLGEATDGKVGLLVDADRRDLVLGRGPGRYAAPDPDAPIHESLTRWWNLAEFVPKGHFNWQTRQEERRMNLFQRRTIPNGSLVHWAAFDRRDNYADRLPPNVRVLPRACAR